MIHFKLYIYRKLLSIIMHQVYPTRVWTGTCIIPGDVSKLSTLLKSNLKACQWSNSHRKVFVSWGLLTLLSPQIPKTMFLSSSCLHFFISLTPQQMFIWCMLRNHLLIKEAWATVLVWVWVWVCHHIGNCMFLCQTRVSWIVLFYYAFKPISIAFVNPMQRETKM